MIHGMDHFTITAEDRAKTLDYYCGLLALQEGFRPDLGFHARGLKYELRQQAGAGTWQLFSHDRNGAKVELDFEASETP